MSVKVYNNQSTFTGLEILKLHNLKKKIIFKIFLKKEKLWINDPAVFYRSNPMRYVYKFGKEDIYKNFTWFNFSFLLKVSLTCSKEVSHTTLHFFFNFPKLLLLHQFGTCMYQHWRSESNWRQFTVQNHTYR